MFRKLVFACLCTAFAVVCFVPSYAQEGVVIDQKEFDTSKAIDFDLSAALESLKNLAKSLDSVRSTSQQNLDDLDQKIDDITPKVTCDASTQNLTWNGSRWVCGKERVEELEWYIKGAGACNKACGGGVSTVDIRCRMKLTRRDADEAYCDSLAQAPKPPETQACNTFACAPWVTTPYGACSNTCGTGTQTRMVTCPSGVCDPDAKPSSSRTCSNHSAPGCYTGTWVAGSCNVSCGNGVITGSTCVGGNGKCDPRTAPDGTVCNMRGCVTGTWTTGAWGACSGACGGGAGTQTRSVTCVGGACNPFRPASTRSCVNSSACAPVVHGQCGSSTNSCVAGTLSDRSDTSSHYRWYCRGTGGGSMASCLSAKPTSYTGTWNSGGWGACSNTCGSGTQTRSVTCSGGSCNPATKPTSSQSCTGSSGCAPTYTGTWNSGSWGTCSGSCGGGSGTQTRSVTCSGGTCDPSTRPDNSKACTNSTACPKRDCSGGGISILESPPLFPGNAWCTSSGLPLTAKHGQSYSKSCNNGKKGWSPRQCSGTFTCNDGTWQKNVSCSTIAAPCPAQTHKLTQGGMWGGGKSCMANIPALNHNQNYNASCVYTVWDGMGASIRTINKTVRCNGGNLR